MDAAANQWWALESEAAFWGTAETGIGLGTGATAGDGVDGVAASKASVFGLGERADAV